MCECCGGDCKLTALELPEKINDPWPVMIKHLISIGKAQRLLNEILNDDIFFKLSKHNTYWHSLNPDEADKLDDIRGKFYCFHDNLLELRSILKVQEE